MGQVKRRVSEAFALAAAALRSRQHEVVLRIRLEARLALRIAEAIAAAAVLRAKRSVRLDRHAADGIMKRAVQEVPFSSPTRG
jgi:hypothetical protein